jgi:hypothetical protein
MSLYVSVVHPRQVLRWAPLEVAKRLAGELEIINRLLQAENLEPLDINPRSNDPRPCVHPINLGTNNLHELRRLYACAAAGLGYQIPYTPEEAEIMDVEIDEIACNISNSLICHSDNSGYYLPRDFDQILFAPEGAVEGDGILGSSFDLLSRLKYLAPHLWIRLEQGVLANAELQRVQASLDPASDPLGLVQEVWLALFECARVSVETGALVVFNPNFGLEERTYNDLTPNDGSFELRRTGRHALEYLEGDRRLVLELDPGDITTGVFFSLVKTWANQIPLTEPDKARIRQNLSEAFDTRDKHYVIE